jgi:hypothetical protein
MDTHNVETIIGLDNIVDYSSNFSEDKEAFYEILSMIDEKKDIMTMFDTKDGRFAFFSSGKSETDEKEFIMFVGNSPIDIMKHFEKKYVELHLDFSMDEETKEKQAKSILILSRSLVHIAGLKEEDFDYEDNN